MSKNRLRSKMSKFDRVGPEVVLILGAENGFSHNFFKIYQPLLVIIFKQKEICQNCITGLEVRVDGVIFQVFVIFRCLKDREAVV